MAATASVLRTPVWMLAGVGRMLPTATWHALLAARHVAAEAGTDLVASGLVDRVVGSAGAFEVADMLALCDCPVVPELFVTGPAPT
ncbi:MAG: hypothetical protein R2698_07845 [Microthrixaceae bacterium]